jgi:hypothetical protein
VWKDAALRLTVFLGITLNYNTHSYYLVDKKMLDCYHLNYYTKRRG